MYGYLGPSLTLSSSNITPSFVRSTIISLSYSYKRYTGRTVPFRSHSWIWTTSRPNAFYPPKRTNTRGPPWRNFMARPMPTRKLYVWHMCVCVMLLIGCMCVCDIICTGIADIFLYNYLFRERCRWAQRSATWSRRWGIIRTFNAPCPCHLSRWNRTLASWMSWQRPWRLFSVFEFNSILIEFFAHCVNNNNLFNL